MLQKLVHLIFEALHLKHIKHEGRRKAGVQFPDSVAEHSLNAAQIGYIIAKMEGADAQRVVTMLVWHDLGETRVGDLDKVAARYFPNKKEAEQQALQDQLAGIDFAEDIHSLFQEYEERSTLEGKIAKDADYLEQAFQGKIYVEQGYAAAQDRIDNVGSALQTESAKSLWSTMVQTNSYAWRKETHLKKIGA